MHGGKGEGRQSWKDDASFADLSAVFVGGQGRDRFKVQCFRYIFAGTGSRDFLELTSPIFFAGFLGGVDSYLERRLLGR